jgi:hypothetical protein
MTATYGARISAERGSLGINRFDPNSLNQLFLKLLRGFSRPNAKAGINTGQRGTLGVPWLSESVFIKITGIEVSAPMPAEVRVGY